MRFSDRSVFVLLFVASFGLLAGGLVLGEIERLQPCHLCIFQRLLYMLAGFFALCGALLPRLRPFWCVPLVLVTGGGLITAVKQSWMQYAPDLATECGLGDPTLVEQIVNWLGGQWPDMFMVTGFCTSKDWIFLNLSLANWSAVCFFVLLVVSAWTLLKRGEKR